MLTGARAELATRRRRRARRRHALTVAPSFSLVATRPARDPAHLLWEPAHLLTALRSPIYGCVTAYRLTMLTFSPVASAAHAAGIAAADVVPFAWVADVVRDETLYRAALESAKRAGSITAADAARRLAESNGRVCDAVCAAADGFDAEPVVAIERGNACESATLQAAGVSYVRPLATVAGGVVASHNGRATVAFDSITDAVAHAAGDVRRPILPGETMPPLAPSHGADAPELPSIAAAFRAENDRLRAIGDRATASAFARLASMRATIDAELARDC